MSEREEEFEDGDPSNDQIEDCDDPNEEGEEEDEDEDEESSEETRGRTYRAKSLSTKRKGSRKKKSTSRKLWQQSVSPSNDAFNHSYFYYALLSLIYTYLLLRIGR